MGVEPSRRGLTTRLPSAKGFHVIAYHAAVDVQRELVWFAGDLLLAERRLAARGVARR